jgi:hypothetical protein
LEYDVLCRNLANNQNSLGKLLASFEHIEKLHRPNSIIETIQPNTVESDLQDQCDLSSSSEDNNSRSFKISSLHPYQLIKTDEPCKLVINCYTSQLLDQIKEYIQTFTEKTTSSLENGSLIEISINILHKNFSESQDYLKSIRSYISQIDAESHAAITPMIVHNEFGVSYWRARVTFEKGGVTLCSGQITLPSSVQTMNIQYSTSSGVINNSCAQCAGSTDDIIKRWVLANPPKDGESTTSYFEKARSAKITDSMIFLAHILKSQGYVNYRIHNTHCWKQKEK